MLAMFDGRPAGRLNEGSPLGTVTPDGIDTGPVGTGIDALGRLLGSPPEPLPEEVEPSVGQTFHDPSSLRTGNVEVTGVVTCVVASSTVTTARELSTLCTDVIV